MGRMSQMMEHMSLPFEDYDGESMEGQEDDDDEEPLADAPPSQNAPQFVSDGAINNQVGVLVGDIQLTDAERPVNICI